jgi:hypothetical protein
MKRLLELQRDTFRYFLHEANLGNGLVPDSTRHGAPASIAAIGLALACYPVGVERGYVRRAEGAARVLTTLRFFKDSPQGLGPDLSGYKGFYYHFLDMATGRRAGGCELSTIDTAILLAGALTAAAYFDAKRADEREIRDTAELLYRRADWQWALNDGLGVTHGWHPEKGFIRHRWSGYNEAWILYVLAMGSPTHPVSPANYAVWTSTFEWKKLYGFELLYGGPLFLHQLSHIWIDFRGIQDPYMRAHGIDYFENSRRATYVQQAYAAANPRKFSGYGPWAWGITASDGPGDFVRQIRGVRRRFYSYRARGVPWGPDDGTLSPWAVVASLPFAPEIVLPTMGNLVAEYPGMRSRYGFFCSVNPTVNGRAKDAWIAKGYYGIDQGPVVLMIENALSGFVWSLMRKCPHIVRGLRGAGFAGGWME